MGLNTTIDLSSIYISYKWELPGSPVYLFNDVTALKPSCIDERERQPYEQQ